MIRVKKGLDIRFERMKNEGKGVLIAYFPLGEPGFDAVEMAKTYYENGVDVLEIGFPVMNPFLDGKVVTDSMRRILSADFGPEQFFEQMARIHEAVPEVSLEVFGYKQLFDCIETADFIRACEGTGVESILITDLNLMERQELDKKLPESIYNLRFLPFDFNDEAIADAQKSSGYVFYQAATGSTGARKELDGRLAGQIAIVKQRVTDTPICPGFGISTPEHCRSIMQMGGDGVIIGSLVLDTVVRYGFVEVGRLIRTMKEHLIR